MNANLLKSKEQLKMNLEISLELLNKEIDEIKATEEPVFTTRQLKFRQDDAQALVNKYRNIKYEKYKKEIVNEIRTKYQNLKKRKEKNEKNLAIFEKFISEMKEEMKNKE